MASFTPARVTLVVLATLHLALLWYSCEVHSVTVDELGHFAAGVHSWQTGRFNLYRVNPPVIRMLATLPARLILPNQSLGEFRIGVHDRPECIIGDRLFAQNGKAAIQSLVWGRRLCSCLSVIGLLVSFAWAKELFGELAGLLAAVLWSFCPNLLANGSLMTSDAASVSFGLLSCYAFSHWGPNPRWTRSVATGACLALAILTKFTWLILVPLWFVVWVVGLVRRRAFRCIPREASGLLLLFGIALYLINAAYLFEGTGSRLGEFTFVSRFLSGTPTGTPLTPGNRFRDSLFANVPMPVPAHLLTGMDRQKYDFDVTIRSYLRGAWQPSGWWYYYLYALAIKMPLGIGGLAILSMVRLVSQRGRSRFGAIGFLLAAPTVVLTLVSCQTGFSHHFRYVIQVLPFLYIFASGSVMAGQLSRIDAIVRNVAIACCASVIVSSLQVFPHSLSYFNELVGGPRGGHAHLVDSNIDWGQDLEYLRDYVSRLPGRGPIKLAYFGSVDPRAYGIQYALPPAAKPDQPGHVTALAAGHYAVSVNRLRGMYFGVRDGDGRWQYPQPDAYTYFLRRSPTAQGRRQLSLYGVDHF